MERADFLEQGIEEIRALNSREAVALDMAVSDLWALGLLVQIAMESKDVNGYNREVGVRFLCDVKRRLCTPGSVLERLFEINNPPDCLGVAEAVKGAG